MFQERGIVKTPKYAWVVLAVAYLATFAMALITNKVPPMIPVLTGAFGVGLGQVGLLASVFAVAGLFLAIPSGLITQRLGLKTTGSIAMAILVLGAALGALSDSFGFLLFSRILEGVGAAIISVVGAAAIAMWFPRERTGTPMGIHTTAGPISAAVIMPLAPVLVPSIGWNGVWWVSAAVGFVGLVFYWLFMRPAPVLDGPAGNLPPLPGSPGGLSPLKEVLGNRNMRLVTLALVAFNMAVMGLVFLYPTYMNVKLNAEFPR